MKLGLMALTLCGSIRAEAAAVIFSGSEVKALKQNLNLNGAVKILSGTVTPTSSAIDAPAGSIYINTSTGIIYRKTDADLSTNWTIFSDFYSATETDLLRDKNGNLELGVTTGWTASGGSFVAVTNTTHLAFGLKGASWNASAASQDVQSDLVTIPSGLKSASGLGYCYFKTDATDYKIQVVDGSGNTLSEQTIPASSTFRRVAVNFPYPSSGSVRLKLTSASDAAILYYDHCFLGPALNVQTVSQAQILGSASYAATTNCNWSTTSSSFGNFTADSDCPTPTLTGSASAPATKVPGVTFSSIPPGRCEVTAHGNFYMVNAVTTGTSASFRFTDGTNSTDAQAIGMQAGGGSGSVQTVNAPVLMGVFNYTSPQNSVTIQLQAKQNHATVTAGVAADLTPLAISMKCFPSSSQDVIYPEAQAWRVDANISGANPSLGAASVSTYTGIENGSLTLTNNSGTGVISAQIPCSSTNSPSGTTCSSGNESVGVSFTLPRAGDVRACASFTHDVAYPVTAGTSEVSTAFQIVETPNAAQTISQEGKSRGHTRLGKGNDNEQNRSQFLQVCGTFTFSSAGQKTLRLMYEQLVSGTAPTSSVVAADADSTRGQRDIHWEVYPLDYGQQALVINQVSTGTTAGERIERAYVTNSAGTSNCSVSSQSGTWISGITEASEGTCVLSLTSGIFSSAPACVVTPNDAGAGQETNMRFATATTSTQVQVQAVNDASASLVNRAFYIMCMGPR